MVRPALMSCGALLIHGFTATPACLESLAAPLRHAGYLVETPLLAGHGRTVQDLAGVTWAEWYDNVREAYRKLKERAERIYVAGLSLGGLLGLRLILEHPVSALALLATPVFLHGYARWVLPLLAAAPLNRIYPYQLKVAGPAIADPEQRAKFISYPKMPVRALMEIIRLQKEVIPRLGEVTAPVLLIHSPHDTTAPYHNMEFIKNRLGSREVQTIRLERSDHVLTMDYEREFVAEKVLQFFAEHDGERAL